mmetsp:Transcript_48595/g.141558  ORF Transcript_48595/g.141558 Transcript_48595/m.141558 type:complete len:229 (-) Transcript_48595:2296-2982(-)
MRATSSFSFLALNAFWILAAFSIRVFMSARARSLTSGERRRARLQQRWMQITLAIKWKRRLRTKKPRAAAWIIVARNCVTCAHNLLRSMNPRILAWSLIAACLLLAIFFLNTIRTSMPLAMAWIFCAERNRSRARSNSARAIRRLARLTFVRASQPRKFCWSFAAAISRRHTSSYLASNLMRPRYPRQLRWISSAPHSCSSMRIASRHILNLTRKPRACRCIVTTCRS